MFETSISDTVNGRGFPFHHPSSQNPFEGEAHNNQAYILAVIVQHGAGRNGADYCSYVTNAVLRSGGSLESTLVVAPQIYEPGDDGLDDTMLYWSESSDDGVDPDGGAEDWKWGGNSTNELPASISTFSVYDEMVVKLADRNLYPNIRRIVLAGHSAGGQVMQRYSLFSVIGKGGVQSSRVPEDTRISYYVANPSSVTYLGPERPIATAQADRDCDFCVNSTISSKLWRFKIPDASDGSAAASCVDSYNLYGYGLEGSMPAYPRDVSSTAALEQYSMRDVTYMSGSSDICDNSFQAAQNCTDCSPDDGGLDTSCEAYAQGWCRMARLHAFSQYVNNVVYKKHVHNLMEVPYVGHSGCGMFQSITFANSALL